MNLYKMLPIRNVTYTKCYLYKKLPIQKVTYTKSYLDKVYYEMLLYKYVQYETLLIHLSREIHFRE